MIAFPEGQLRLQTAGAAPIGRWPAEPSPTVGLGVAMKYVGVTVPAPNIMWPPCARGVIALPPNSLDCVRTAWTCGLSGDRIRASRR